jgi:hypothetical protein
MTAILERLRLIDHLKTEIQIDKDEFVARFQDIVASGGAASLLFSFEAFSFSKKEYTGTVTADSFRIRKRNKLFDTNIGLAIAEGTINHKEQSLIIDSKIVGFHPFYILFLAMVILIYVFIIVAFISSGNRETFDPIAIPFFIIHAALMLGIPYVIMRRSVSRLKYDLERDLFFLTRNKS